MIDLSTQVRPGAALGINSGGTGRIDGRAQGIAVACFVGGGASVSYGDLVALVSAVDSTVPVIGLTVTAGEPVFGVVNTAGTTAALGTCDVLVIGVHPAVKVTGTTARLDYLIPSSTGGSADPSGTLTADSFGRALGAGTTTVIALLMPVPMR